MCNTILVILFLCVTGGGASHVHSLGWIKDQNPRSTQYIPPTRRYTSGGATLSSASGDSLNYRNLFHRFTDQMGCGSCYAHAIGAVLQANWKRTKWSRIPLYPIVPRNEMIHCFEFNLQCNGGFIEKTLDRIIQIGGLYHEGYHRDNDGSFKMIRYGLDEEQVGFWDPNEIKRVWDPVTKSFLTHMDGDVCLRPHFYVESIHRRRYLTKYISVRPTIQQLKNALQKYGPLVVGMKVTKEYHSIGSDGIYHPSSNACASVGGHAVVLAGYERNHWLFRNSYGSEWGDGGYFRLGMNEPCGLIEAAYALMND